jgi:hypothetical protein
LDSSELQVVERSREAATSALADAAKQIAHVYPKGLAEQFSQMVNSMPKIALPNVLPSLTRPEPLELEYTIPENPSYETNRLLREMTAKLDNLKEQKRHLITFVLQNLLLEGEKVLYEAKKPFDLMAFCAKNENWLRRQDSNL